MLVAPRILCDCGHSKHDVAGFMFCDHCDGGCEIGNPRCGRCRTYGHMADARTGVK